MTGAIGQDIARVDGPAKVTGTARYSGEIALPGLVYAEIVGATIASGQVTEIDTAAAERADGVLRVLTPRDMPKVNQVPLLPSLLGGPAPGETFFPMQDDEIHYAGQPVAIVVADSLEQAQHAATLVRVSYAASAFVSTIDQGRAAAYEPERLFGGLMPGRLERGRRGRRAGRRGPAHRCGVHFAANHHNPIEALTTTAVWDGDQLTLYDSCQGIKAVQLTVAALLGMSPSRIRVLTRYVGGAFGCKAMVWPHVTLTALAAQHVRRPVRLALPRGQMFTSCGHREEQEQHIELGARRDGTLTAIRHQKISVTSPFDDWAEPAFGAASQLYASPAFQGVHRLVRGNTMTPTFTRGPGRGAGRVHPGMRDGRAGQRARHRPDRAAVAQPGRDRPEHRPPVVQLRAAGMPGTGRRAVRLGWAQPAATVRARWELADRHRDGGGRLPGGVLHAHPARPGPSVRGRHRGRADRHPGIRHRHGRPS